MRSAITTILALTVLATAVAPGIARADGDPASDVLLREDVFYPYSEPVSADLQKKLDAEMAAATQAHFPIKVALIQSAVDLGAVTSLFDRPQRYADFLEQEIDFQTRQPLLVVMPQGFGVQGLSGPSAAAAGSLIRPTGGQSDDLARAAIAAVDTLAAAAGHRIGTDAGSSAADAGGPSGTLVLGALAFAALAAGAALYARGARGRLAWSGRVQPAGGFAPPDARGVSTTGVGAAPVQPLQMVALVLILAGVVWAAARGLRFYGVGLVDVGYDLDQPPLLLMFVAGWLWYRSRRR